ncbi:MAG: SPASM domain-containing protein [Acidobacteria bacterium]|nr:SPASM domain-containing protein [Acidobacteriota bacterium]
MKQSYYNFFFKLESNGQYLAYNARENGLALVDERLKSVVCSLSPGDVPQLPEEVARNLRLGGFIVDDEMDEYRLLQVRRRQAQYDSKRLGLTIAPTQNCNLACKYCYETPSRLVMDEQTIERTEAFVKQQIDSGVKGLDIAWYGGEPLLCMDVIAKLSSRLIALCDGHGVNYNAAIVTNGTLFSRTTAERLKDLRVWQAQITVDGDRWTHDQRRPYRGGQGSFEKIIGNIKEACGVIQIIIRINIDTNNADHALTFFDDLTSQPWFEKEKITAYFGHVRKTTNSCKCSEEECLKCGDFWKHEAQLHNLLAAKGLGAHPYPTAASGCGATTLMSSTIGPRGEIYKCWNDCGDSTKIVGSLHEPSTLSPLHLEYLTESFETDEECRECKVLPLCMGGCVDIRIKAKRGEADSKDCSRWRYYLEDTLRKFYLQKMKEQAKAKPT